MILESNGTLIVPPSSIDPSSVYSSTSGIQDAIDWMFANYGGGKVILPHPNGHYFVPGGIVIKGAVMLSGHGRSLGMIQCQNIDSPVIMLDASVSYGGFEDLFVVGMTSTAATNNAVSVADNVPASIKNCRIWGGNSALFTMGVDGEYENLFLSGWVQANLLSNGANWYSRCKLDTSGSRPKFAYIQGTPYATAHGGVVENHFELCDFSGDFAGGSIDIDDGGAHSALTFFTDCITSGPIGLNSARHTSFTAHEFGSPSLYMGTGTCSITGSLSFQAMRVPKADKAGNTNIF